MRLILISVAAVVTLSGCATANWQHPQIKDKTKMARQLVIDDGYCTQVASGSAPMPMIVAAPSSSTTTFSARGPSGSYSGRATTTPTNSFSSGFASGASMGAAFNARKEREKIHKSCMFAKGWEDAPVEAVAPSVARVPDAIAARPALPFDARTLVYANLEEEWVSAVIEFLHFYPAYDEPHMTPILNRKVQEITKAQPGQTGPQALLATHAALAAEGRGAPEPSSKRILSALRSYKDAAAGKTSGQVEMGMLYIAGNQDFAIDYERSAAWLQPAAIKADSIAQTGLGVLLFDGLGVPQNRIEGYRLMYKASLIEPEAMRRLKQFEQEMTPAELRLAKSKI